LNQNLNQQKKIFQPLGYSQFVAIVPILFLVILSGGLFASQYLLPSVTGLKYISILNTVLYAVPALIVSYIAGKVYVLSGATALLLLGNGLLAAGIGSFLAGWMLDLTQSLNISVTIYNLGVLFSSFFLTGSSWMIATQHPVRAYCWRRILVLAIYSGTALLMFLVALATVAGMMPTFFVQGEGPTPLRQLVLGTGTFLYCLSGAMLITRYSRARSNFLMWYSLSLFLISFGLILTLQVHYVGSMLNWLGRAAQYLGVVYILLAASAAIKEAKENEITSEQGIIEFLLDAEKNYQASFYKNIVGQARDIILVVHINGKILDANQEAILAYGYTLLELRNIGIYQLRASDKRAMVDDQMNAALEHGILFRTTHVRRNGEQFPVEVSSRSVRVLEGKALVSIIRDITATVAMETALQKSEEKYRILHKTIEKDNQFLEEKVRVRTAELEKLNQSLKMEIEVRKRAEQRYQFLFNSINDAILVYPLDSIDNPGTFIEVNDVACEKLGYTRAELMELTIFDINPQITTSFHQQKKQGKLLLETTHLSKNGREIPVEVNINVLASENMIVTIVRDITLRKKEQWALQRKLEMEEILASISRKLISCPFENINQEINECLAIIGQFTGVDRNFIFIDNVEGTRSTMTHFWCRNHDVRYAGFPDLYTADYAWERTQFAKQDFFVISTIDDLPAEAQSGKKFMEAFSLKSLLIMPMVCTGRIIGLIGLGTVHQIESWDQEEVVWLKLITELIINMIELQRAHNALILRDKEYRALLDAVPDHFFEVDKEGMIRSARGNQNWNLRLSEEVVGKKLIEVLPPQLVPKFLENIRNVIMTKSMRTFEFDSTIDNGLFIGETRIVSYKDDEALVVIRDITEEKWAEEKMIEASRLVEQGQRLASLGIMATSLAHEINQPLNSIKVSASGVVYAHNNGVRPTKADMIIELEWISEQADRIDAIIKNIGMFVRNDYSNCQPISLNCVIEQAIQTLASQPLFQDILIEMEFDDNLPPVLANAVHLQQVVTNLMINAAQSLLTSSRNFRMIEIKAWAHDAVIVEVIDNGMGFHDEMKTKIFEPFFTTKTGSHAMGLGLAIAQTIVNAYGGKVNAYNNELGGATFHLEFPKITVRKTD